MLAGMQGTWITHILLVEMQNGTVWQFLINLNKQIPYDPQLLSWAFISGK